MKVIGIAGSLRPESHTCQAVRLALREVELLGAETELCDLRDYNLPFCTGESSYPDYPDVTRLRVAVQSAHSVILGTPEYHGTLSGVLKNALDLLESTHVEHHVCGVIGICGGVHSSLAVNTIYTICRHLHALTIPHQLIVPHASSAFDEKGEFRDPILKERLSNFAKSLLAFTQKNHPSV